MYFLDSHQDSSIVLNHGVAAFPNEAWRTRDICGTIRTPFLPSYQVF